MMAYMNIECSMSLIPSHAIIFLPYAQTKLFGRLFIN